MYSTLGLLKKGAGGGGSSGGGTFPSIASVTYTTDTASPYAADMPATVVAGELLIMLLSRVSSGLAPTGTPVGWSVLFSGMTVGYYKWAAGTEGGTSVALSGTGSTEVIFSVLRIQGADSAQNPQGEYHSEGTTSTPNPSAVDPTWADHKNLFIAWAGTVGVRTVISYPSGYILHQQERDELHGTIGIAAKQVTVSTSEDPGAFSISGSANTTYVSTIAVKGAP